MLGEGRAAPEFGWLDARIGEIVHEEPMLLGRFEMVYVTALDSQVALSFSAVAAQLAERVPSLKRLGSGLVLSGPAAAAAAAQLGLFSGFDELWAFNHDPGDAKPAGISLLPPPRLDEHPPSAELLAWFEESECVLGLADGLGLNYITADPRLARGLAWSIGGSDDPGLR